ncbi:AraC family transcriptional regulator [Pararhizobium polonicum]|uniref:NADP-dependent 3-hydroxy acid dehydrogenase YdfG n=1 Tax=Pararhizobium polonicum TaxID=1612624 RepID=A0A1C7P2P8_9HYPH|nr:AraC family transcriptional regulator [Pararhizobium polonicum]
MTNSEKPVALITGASSGIGAVYAERLAKRGYDLILVARRIDRLNKHATDLSSLYGSKVEVREADLTAESDVADVENVLRSDSRITLLVNNAGNGKLGKTADISHDDTMSTIALNVVALTRLTRAALPHFVDRNSGAIINIASVMALHSLPITSLYSATKAFVLSFSRGLQEELAGTGVKVQTVLPAGTATEFYDQAGIPLSAFDPELVMSTTELVDAALAGFDKGELVTLPSVENLELWSSFNIARNDLFAATQSGKPASRYQTAPHGASGL